MFKGINLKPYITHALMAALLYCLPVIFFLKAADYTRAWELYIGNFLFLLVIVLFLFTFNKKRDENAGTLLMLTASSITTVLGTIAATILGLGLLLIFVPGLLQSGTPDKVLINAPGNSVLDKTDGLVFMVISNAIIGNVSSGLFVSIIFPFSMKS
ncbi:MAG TPA: hypothetical protein VK625_10740 [Flavitalea sp.]|nr:hypothetical protein [Flavitalea sp.]